jgi:hypothetical protein
MNKRVLIAVVTTVIPRQVFAQGQAPPEILVAENMGVELSQVAFPYRLSEIELDRKLRQEWRNADDLATLMSLCSEDIQKADEMCEKAAQVKRKFEKVIQHYPAGQRRDAITQGFYYSYDMIMERRVNARVRLMMTFFQHRWAWEKQPGPSIKGRLFLVLYDVFCPQHDVSFPHLRYFARHEMWFEDVARAIIGQ